MLRSALANGQSLMGKLVFAGGAASLALALTVPSASANAEPQMLRTISALRRKMLQQTRRLWVFLIRNSVRYTAAGAALMALL